jgi:hypothetical protein
MDNEVKTPPEACSERDGLIMQTINNIVQLNILFIGQFEKNENLTQCFIISYYINIIFEKQKNAAQSSVSSINSILFLVVVYGHKQSGCIGIGASSLCSAYIQGCANFNFLGPTVQCAGV